MQGIVNEMDKSEKSKIKDKTNAMRIIESKKLEYKLFTCPCEEAKSADEIAVIFGKESERVFKTLVTVGKSGEHYVFMLPACDELDLKKAAKAVGEKSVEMIKSKELLPLTGYIHGGCSPVGMKKFFRTTAHITAQDYETVTFSAGRIGWMMEMAPGDLGRAIRLGYADITREHE